jgi:NAD(P)-dependent dehydrogenase (short-subunit alcohol dehydrogenase family)
VLGLSAYHAAESAIESFTEALAQDVTTLGINVTNVEPGGFRTDWSGASMGNAKPPEAYRPTVGAMRDFLQPYAGREPGDPRMAANVILGITGEANLSAACRRWATTHGRPPPGLQGRRRGAGVQGASRPVRGLRRFTVSDEEHAVLKSKPA